MITMIWAQDKNGVIGKNGKLPWHLPNDLTFFKKTTENHTIIMGRKTFEGMEKRLLPNRKTIILTHNNQYDANGAEVETDFMNIVKLGKKESIFIVGGSKLYELFAPYADCLIQTKIDAAFDGDAFMPILPFEKFEQTNEIIGIVNEKNRYAHTFCTFCKKEIVRS